MQDKFCRLLLRRLILLSVVLVPIAIFPFANQIFSMAKMLVFSTITLLALILVGIDIYKAGGIFVPLSNKNAKLVFIGAGGYIMALILSTITSVSPYVSFWGTYQRTLGLYVSLQFVLFATIIIYLRMTKEEIAKVLRTLAITSIVISIFGILQYFNLDLIFFDWNKDEFLGRIFATFGHPNFFGAFLIMTIPLAVSEFLKSCKSGFPNSLGSYLWLIGLCLQLSALLLTGNRGAWLGLFVVALLFLWLSFRKHKDKRVLIPFFLLLIVPCFVLISANFFSKTQPEMGSFINRFVVDDENTRSLSTRGTMIPLGFKLIWEKPIFGHGIETLTTILPRHMTKDLLLTERADSIPDRVHNDLIDTALSIGIVGLFFYCLLLVYVLWLSLRQEIDPLALGIVGLIVANQFSFNTITSTFLLWLFLAIIISKLCFTSKTTQFGNKLSVKLIASVCVLLSFVGLFYNQRVLFADYYYRQFLENRDEHLIDIEKASELSPFLYPKLQLLNTYYNDADFHTEAEDKLISEIKRKNIGLYQLYLLEGRLRMKNGEYPLANESFAHGTFLAPMSLDLWREWGDNLHYSNLNEEAIEKYEHMLSLIPPYWENKYSEASRLFYKHNPKFNSVFVLLARSYYSLGDSDSALKYLAFSDEDDVDALTTFAVIYGEKGEREKALKYYQEASVLDPYNEIITSSIEYLKNLE